MNAIDMQKWMAEEGIEAANEAHAGGKLPSDVEAVKRFILAGNARFTLVSPKTGARFTFRIRGKEDRSDKTKTIFFVSLLTGSNNDTDYTFFATIFPDAASFGRLSHARKGNISEDAPGARAFAWFWRQLNAAAHAGGSHGQIGCEVHHEGRCGRCGRALTVPESIACGLGPECAGKVGA